ncbi:hypothetical protein HYDPIDRAFT_107958 [Hydnomerulius pinastri MD-312]|nr:hypothetical protein HYDPIDRAFT_107958 [Hydnomerulius pinastri MD-312]
MAIMWQNRSEMRYAGILVYHQCGSIVLPIGGRFRRIQLQHSTRLLVTLGTGNSKAPNTHVTAGEATRKPERAGRDQLGHTVNNRFGPFIRVTASGSWRVCFADHFEFSPEYTMATVLAPPGAIDISQSTFDAVSRNLLNIGGLSLDEYLYGSISGSTKSSFNTATRAVERPLSPLPVTSLPEVLPSTGTAKATETVNVNAVTRLHQTCQRVFGNTDALKFEFIEENGPKSKQCILSITRPDGSKRSYTTQPTFSKKNEAKAEVAKIAIEMDVLDFLVNGEEHPAKIGRGLVLSSIAAPGAEAVATEGTSSTSKISDESASSIDEIHNCCAQWRAGRIAPHWVAFFEPKLSHKQGCALRIQLSPHVVRVYISDPTFDNFAEAKAACAKVAISEGVLDFIKHGNGQTRPLSPEPFSSSDANARASALVNTKIPLTLQSFFDSLPRPFPESFETNDAAEINAPGWLNTMVQNARGGKLAMTFSFTSDGTPGLHGCLLKLVRPGDYRTYLVDARFPKRADAKAAVCLQAMSCGIGDYIRATTLAAEQKVTPAMRSFSTNYIYPILTSELSKIGTGLHPRFEFEKERDAVGATLIIELSAAPSTEEVKRYPVPSDYRNKADAKAAAICYAAEQGAVEFIRYRGGQPPPGYISPYTMRSFDPEVSQKRKHPEGGDEAEQARPTKKQKKGKKRDVDGPSTQGESSQTSLANPSQHTHGGSHHVHSVLEPGGIGPSPGVSGDRSFDQSQPGFGNEGGSGAVYIAPYGYRDAHPVHPMHVVPHFGSPPYMAPYPGSFDPRFAQGGMGAPGGYHGYGIYQAPVVYASNPYHHPTQPPYYLTQPSTSSSAPMRFGPADPEPGEVLSSRESEFSESSSQDSRRSQKRESKAKVKKDKSGDLQSTPASKEKKGKGKFTANPSGSASSEGRSNDAKSHMKSLTDCCARHGLGTPMIHEEQSDHMFKVWIIIGKERFELPAVYHSVREGRERIAKQVLARLRSQRNEDEESRDDS